MLGDINGARELSFDELTEVNGGRGSVVVNSGAVVTTDNKGGVLRECPSCHEMVTFMVHSGGRAVCPKCGAPTII